MNKQILLATLTLVIGCGSGGGGGSQEIEVFSFDGLYWGPCSGKTRAQVRNVAENQISVTINHYVDDNCVNRLLSRQVVYQVQEVNKSSNLDGFMQVTFVPGKTVIKPLMPAMAADLNSANYCGFSDWAYQTEKEVDDCEGEIVTSGEPIFTIILQREKEMYFGVPTEGRDGTSPEKRHNTLGEEKFNRLTRIG